MAQTTPQFRIDVRPRLPIWGLRLLLGAVLLTFSEVVMWQNPVAHRPFDWPILLILYVALAAIMLDLTVRFQVRDPGSMLLIGTAYALIHAAALNPGVFVSFPVTLLVRGLGLQTAAGVYALLLFVIVMRGKQLVPWHLLGAVAIGVLWGVWLHWFPLQTAVGWGLVPLATAQTYAVILLVAVGLLFFFVGPRFRVIREKQFELLWWERAVAIVPLFIAVLIGMVQNLIPIFPLLVIIAMGAYVGWALNFQRYGYDPSILAEIMFAAPNLINYVAFSVVFFVTGVLAYGLIVDKDTLIGNILYYVVLGFGTLALPTASVLIFFTYLNRRSQEKAEEDAEGDD
ncbi:MAG: hypothetical protein KF716_23900 [Anaerolineae bacterium]|nr:hypothetical protein [Anaerolineae bacterium]